MPIARCDRREVGVNRRNILRLKPTLALLDSSGGVGWASSFANTAFYVRPGHAAIRYARRRMVGSGGRWRAMELWQRFAHST